MSRRLFHFLLAVAVAFVFTGRMEAAARHCRGLASSDMAMTMPMGDTAGTAGMNMKDTDMSAMPDCHGANHPGKTHSPANDPCECLALLTADCPVIDTPQRSACIAPFSWQASPTVAFASLEAAPDKPPPRA